MAESSHEDSSVCYDNEVNCCLTFHWNTACSPGSDPKSGFSARSAAPERWIQEQYSAHQILSPPHKGLKITQSGIKPQTHHQISRVQTHATDTCRFMLWRLINTFTAKPRKHRFKISPAWKTSFSVTQKSQNTEKLLRAPKYPHTRGLMMALQSSRRHTSNSIIFYSTLNSDTSAPLTSRRILSVRCVKMN